MLSSYNKQVKARVLLLIPKPEVDSEFPEDLFLPIYTYTSGVRHRDNPKKAK